MFVDAAEVHGIRERNCKGEKLPKFCPSSAKFNKHIVPKRGNNNCTQK